MALCGYHGWHDWYLAANLADERNLDGHQLPGLSTDGVPKGLRGSVHPFAYNDLMALEALVNSYDIGVIKMEVSRYFGPQPGFLESVRDIATRNGIVLIFDECTLGLPAKFWRAAQGVRHRADMAVFRQGTGQRLCHDRRDRQARDHGGGADHLHLLDLLDRAGRPDGGAGDPGGDGARTLVGEDHRDRQRHRRALEDARPQSTGSP